MAEENNKKSFKDTLNLPHTDFPIRPNAQENDPKMIERWQQENLYEKTYEARKGAQKFVLHDGPPYANGNIHLGHAYNKILKDIIGKFNRMSGKHVPIIPGWDCHGLPIELGVKKEQPELAGIELKKACRVWAQKWVDVQREQFKDLGILMNWDHPYKTMDPVYEADTIRALGQLVAKGYIERKNKTVAWCGSCQTVLASAEIEYKDRKDPSVYVLFPLVGDAGQLLPELKGKEVNLCVWTTTPWTLPLNRAVLVHPNGTYDVRKYKDTYFVVGSGVSEKVDKLLEGGSELVGKISGSVFKNLRAQHPFIQELDVPFIADTSVELNEGTAFVHCAPGAGPIDYEIGVKNNLEIFAPVGPDGKYGDDIMPAELAGMSVQDGQIWVIRKLAHTGKLLAKKSITHSYPHCWRCRNGLIFRATRQWFVDLKHNDLQSKALLAVNNNINFIPENSRNFLHATVGSRWEWCISRQRIWGTPIPALICQQCDTTIIDNEIIEKVADGVQKNGVEYWDQVAIDDLIKKGTVCKTCNSAQFRKEMDILDVWFDAGVSHYAVLYDDKNENLFPADLYLEGIDQHRGWFQSSLLTSLIIEGEPAMKAIMTHGFTVDGKGQKMSKSQGNVVAPADITKKLGTDGLRLWVSSIGIEGDAIVSDTLLKNVAEVFRKVRNTMRFLLSNLSDFDKSRDGLKPEDMLPVDQYALEQLYAVQENILSYYGNGQFTGVFHELGDYASAELSSFYLDIIKDRLYVEKSDGHARRSAQTACWYILDSLMRLVAPIMSFTAEQVSDFFEKDKKESIHLQRFAELREIKEWLEDPTVEDVYIGQSKAAEQMLHKLKIMGMVGTGNPTWNALKKVRGAVLKAIEKLREQDIVKHSLEAQVRLYIDINEEPFTVLKSFFEELKKRGIDLPTFLKEFFIVSRVHIESAQGDLNLTEVSGVFVDVSRADGIKCPRCWHYDETNHSDGLCARCQVVLDN